MEWIKITDRLPTKDEVKNEQLLICICGLVCQAEYWRHENIWMEDGTNTRFNQDNITHWCIPNLPTD